MAAASRKALASSLVKGFASVSLDSGRIHEGRHVLHDQTAVGDFQGAGQDPVHLEHVRRSVSGVEHAAVHPLLVRAQELLRRFLPPAPARVLDVGGGTGIHAEWLVRDGLRRDIGGPPSAPAISKAHVDHLLWQSDGPPALPGLRLTVFAHRTPHRDVGRDAALRFRKT